MNIQFKQGGKYTVIEIISWLAITTRREIVITGFDETTKRYTYKKEGQHKEFYIWRSEEQAEKLFFEGHGLPFVVDTETNRFMGNACFNFVTDTPGELKTFIKQNCLNPSYLTFTNIFYTSTNPASEQEEERLFPENEIQ